MSLCIHMNSEVRKIQVRRGARCVHSIWRDGFKPSLRGRLGLRPGDNIRIFYFDGRMTNNPPPAGTFERLPHVALSWHKENLKQ